MKLIFKSEINHLKIYVSYEFEGPKKEPKVDRDPTSQQQPEVKEG